MQLKHLVLGILSTVKSSPSTSQVSLLPGIRGAELESRGGKEPGERVAVARFRLRVAIVRRTCRKRWRRDPQRLDARSGPRDPRSTEAGELRLEAAEKRIETKGSDRVAVRRCACGVWCYLRECFPGFGRTLDREIGKNGTRDRRWHGAAFPSALRRKRSPLPAGRSHRQRPSRFPRARIPAHFKELSLERADSRDSPRDSPPGPRFSQISLPFSPPSRPPRFSRALVGPAEQNARGFRWENSPEEQEKRRARSHREHASSCLGSCLHSRDTSLVSCCLSSAQECVRGRTRSLVSSSLPVEDTPRETREETASNRALPVDRPAADLSMPRSRGRGADETSEACV